MPAHPRDKGATAGSFASCCSGLQGQQSAADTVSNSGFKPDLCHKKANNLTKTPHLRKHHLCNFHCIQ